MVVDIECPEQYRDSTVSRRAVLRSGVAVAAGGYLAQSGVDTASAQTDDNWPIQGKDSGNTSESGETAALVTEPTVVAQDDPPVTANSDYLLTQETAYIHTAENGISAIDITTGEMHWQFSQNDQQLIPEGIDGSDVLVRSFDGDFFAIDTGTGTISYEAELDQGYGLGYNGTGRWYAPVSDGRVVAGEESETLWEVDVEGVGFRPAEDSGKIFLPTVDASPSDVDPEDPASINAEGRLYALETEDGTVSWEATRSGGGMGDPAVRFNTVYWPGTDGDIMALDDDTGDELWTFETDGSFPLSPAVTNGLVYAGNQDGTLYGIDPTSGEEVGRFSVDSPITTNPVVVDEAVYFGTDNGLVYAVERENPEQLWEYDAGTAVQSLAPGNNALVVGTETGYQILSGEDSSTGSNATPAQNSTPTGQNQIGENSTTTRQRGLFSNSGDEPEFVSNPFNLTMLGFLLSVAGIVHQMLQGR